MTSSQLNGANNSCANIATIDMTGFEEGDVVVVVATIEWSGLSVSSSGTPRVYVQFSGSSTGWDGGRLSGGNSVVSTTAGSAIISGTATITSTHLQNSYENVSIRVDYVSGGTVTIKNMYYYVA